MAWRLFGKSVTNEIAVNSLKCGDGNLGIEETFNTYFLGIRTSSGNTGLRCLKVATNAANRIPDPITFNSINCDMKALAGQKVLIEKEFKSNWYKWTCNIENGSGVAQTERNSQKQGEKYCGSGNYNLSRVLVTHHKVQYDEVFF